MQHPAVARRKQQQAKRSHGDWNGRLALLEQSVAMLFARLEIICAMKLTGHYETDNALRTLA
jgi:hypothetical protein